MNGVQQMLLLPRGHGWHLHVPKGGRWIALQNIPLLHAINALCHFNKLDPAGLEEGNGITQQSTNAYHQRCKHSFNNTSSRDRKMQRISAQPHASECVICVLAKTMKLNKRLNECAKTLNDGQFIAILGAGDAQL